MKKMKHVVVNAVSILMFAIGPQQTAAQSTWQKVAGTAANASNAVGLIRDIKDARASKRRDARIVSPMPSATQVAGPAQNGACDPGLVKITSLNKNPMWTGVLLQLQQGFKKRGWCYVVPGGADGETYFFGLAVVRENEGSSGNWLNGFGPGGSTNRGGSNTIIWYNIQLTIYKPNGSMVGSAEAKVPVPTSDFRQSSGSAGGAYYNRHTSNQSYNPDNAAIREALDKFFG